jgi:prepilin-type N-terminal cleavage/methylation domain-containing protein
MKSLSVTHRRSAQSGMTLLELIIACAILLILSSAALPVARFTVVRQREKELRLDLREMRNAIDRYKDLADRNMIRTELGSEGYPPDLQTLVNGDCAPCRTIPTPPVGVGRTYSMCTQNRRGQRWTERSIRIGRKRESP